MSTHGIIRLKLEEQIKKSGISKSKICHRAEMERTQLNRYCKNDIARIDLDVLARLCAALECDICDLIEYIPPEE
ncbi:MAG: helix-turn-helix transcriptional regulator [Clostridia bacterium]|nr:helix-turn-helix transcriptional regulator [Clostridia bacterium]